MAGTSKQRLDADKALLRLQTRMSVRERIQSETEVIDQERAANTSRLKMQRLEKEAAEREALAARPKKPNKRALLAG